MTGGQQDPTGGFSFPDDMTGCRCAQDAILSDEELLHSIGSANLGNQLDDFGVEVATITTNDQEASLGALRNGEQDTGDERLAVVGLLKDLDLFAEARAASR